MIRFALQSIFTLLIGIASAQFLHSQTKLIRGTIIDATTREHLPLANIQIEGTMKGAISNREGKYEIRIETMPAVLFVRYIGYKSRRIPIDETTPLLLDIELIPNPVEFSEIIITSEDPGMRLMRGVITKKMRWRKLLQTFEADAYSRLTLSNDTMIVMMMESLSTVFWDEKRGLREIVRSKRNTANIDTAALFSVTSRQDGIVNFYDDDIRIQGSEFIGPTHPQALDYYSFSILKRRTLDEKIIVDIAVKPKTLYQPLFTGTLAVIEEDSIIIEVNLRPHERVLFPPPIKEWDVAYRQQFNNFGFDFWLPVDVRQEGKIKIGVIGLDFPYFYYQFITGLNEYRVNVELPDTLFTSKKKRFIDSTTLRNTTLFDSTTAVIPLTVSEIEAYDRIDSDLTISEAFKPRGPLARFVRARSGSERQRQPKESGWSLFLRRVSPDLRFNRVEGFHIGAGYEFRLNPDFSVTPRGGYSAELQRWTYGGEARFHWGKPHRFRPKPWRLQAGFSNRIENRYPSYTHSLFSNSLAVLFGRDDYFDYFLNRNIYFGIAHDFRNWDIQTGLKIQNEHHRSIEKTTHYNIPGTHRPQRENPPIDEGQLRSVVWHIGYGGDYKPLGVMTQKYILLQIEHSSPGLFQSDFRFTSYRFVAEWTFPTFFKRRFLSNMLIVLLNAGTYSGQLPRQRFGIVESAQWGYTPFGTLRTNQRYPYEGEKYASFFWEHNFRTVPFEILGLDFLVKRNISFIIFGGSGRTWIKEQRLQSLTYPPRYLHRFHHEAGISLSGFFDLLRFDLARRLDRPVTTFGLSLARIF